MSDKRMTTEQIAALVAETRNLPDSFTVEADAIDFEPLCSAIEQLQATLVERDRTIAELRKSHAEEISEMIREARDAVAEAKWEARRDDGCF